MIYLIETTDRRSCKTIHPCGLQIDQIGYPGRQSHPVGEHTTVTETPPIRQLSAPELRALIDGGARVELVDVRTEQERATARIDGSRLLDQAYHDALLRLDRETLIVFQCHHGVRSQ